MEEEASGYAQLIDEVREKTVCGSSAKQTHKSLHIEGTGPAADASNRNCDDVQSKRIAGKLRCSGCTRKFDVVHRLINVGFFEK